MLAGDIAEIDGRIARLYVLVQCYALTGCLPDNLHDYAKNAGWLDNAGALSQKKVDSAMRILTVKRKQYLLVLLW